MNHKIKELLNAAPDLDQAIRDQKDAYKRWVTSAKAMGGKDWKDLWSFTPFLDKHKNVHLHAAMMIWWDYFSPRPVSDRWNHLDAQLALWDSAKDLPDIDPFIPKEGKTKNVKGKKVLLTDSERQNVGLNTYRVALKKCLMLMGYPNDQAFSKAKSVQYTRYSGAPPKMEEGEEDENL